MQRFEEKEIVYVIWHKHVKSDWYIERWFIKHVCFAKIITVIKYTS